MNARADRPVRASSPAKINLQLLVGPLRPDGYHGLHTVFQAVDLYDTVRAAPVEPGSGVSIAVRPASGLTAGAQDATDTDRDIDISAVPTDAQNLVWRAAVAVAEAIGRPADVALQITKAIPVAAGLAGGSADAAAALMACNALWGARLTRDELVGLAARLGSDVPFALLGGSAVGRDRGNLLAPVLTSGQFHWVLAVADGGLSTPNVYRELDAMRAAGTAPTASLTEEPTNVADPDAHVLAALRSGDPIALGAALHNDLQAPAVALAPYLHRTLTAGRELGAIAGIVSGSGPTCAFLTAGREQALALAAAIEGTDVCRTTRVVTGPVPGAHIS